MTCSISEFPTDERRGQRLYEELLADSRAVVASMDWDDPAPEKVPLRVVS